VKAFFHFIGSRVGSPNQALLSSAMGQPDSELVHPPPTVESSSTWILMRLRGHSVAVHVAFERHILKPFFHLIGARVETRRLSAMGQGESTVTVSPLQLARAVDDVLAHRRVETHSLPGGVRLVTCATRTRLMGCTHSRGVSDLFRHKPYRLSSIEPCSDC
jgi:hypothetical protein